jgi:hypothetical protein
MEEVGEIFGATKGFMRYLAENLPRRCTGTIANKREKPGL